MNEIETPVAHPGEARKGRGICLLSGGLDSQLAVCVLREQGVTVEAAVFASPFFKIDAAKQAAEHLQVPLHIIPFTTDILSLVKAPPHGFGGAMNPCIDCHARMIQRAGELMVKLGFDFVATGEVLNQRPMSQTRQSLHVVEKSSGLTGRLLRPLSAQCLEPTLPETEGLVDRSKLLNLTGRTRKPQMELAKHFGLVEYPSPAGGCLLTENGFCRKLKDLQNHEGFEDEHLVWLLLVGRQYRLPSGAKCILGRDLHSNAALKKMRRDQDILLHSVDVPGPTALLTLGGSAEDIDFAARLCAAYSDHRGRDKVTIRIYTTPDLSEERSLVPEPREPFIPYML